MKHPARTHTDLDVAEYVLGLAAADDTAEIQAWLARDNAAAACALKWEAYLLGIADDLPGEVPAPALRARIHASLGFTQTDGVSIISERRAPRAEPSRRTSGRRRPVRLRRGRVAAVAAAAVALAVSVLVGVAIWRPAGQQSTEQAVDLVPVNPAVPTPGA
ncbi:hypothetical protein [Castellaniella sp. S9]|uniref:hypothetical protein n=1 Tax=Castellaniella sp. S9 TaxID=2993652 RepID=UPI0022B5B57A|nr:hypothetical protein [Castellaniella sp. S9]